VFHFGTEWTIGVFVGAAALHISCDGDRRSALFVQGKNSEAKTLGLAAGSSGDRDFVGQLQSNPCVGRTDGGRFGGLELKAVDH
jgi:hypothetical protein